MLVQRGRVARIQVARFQMSRTVLPLTPNRAPICTHRWAGRWVGGGSIRGLRLFGGWVEGGVGSGHGKSSHCLLAARVAVALLVFHGTCWDRAAVDVVLRSEDERGRCSYICGKWSEPLPHPGDCRAEHMTNRSNIYLACLLGREKNFPSPLLDILLDISFFVAQGIRAG